MCCASAAASATKAPPPVSNGLPGAGLVEKLGLTTRLIDEVVQ
jgi:hypothetical protein